MISQMFWKLFYWMAIAISYLFSIAVLLAITGSACWLAFAIWQAVFRFFL